MTKARLHIGMAPVLLSLTLPAFGQSGPIVTGEQEFTITVAAGACASERSGLQIGQRLCEEEVYHVGVLSGQRLYAQELSGLYMYKTDFTSSAPTSTSDGVANTDHLISSSLDRHEAARACRLLGNEWYLPSINELNVITAQGQAGMLPHLQPQHVDAVYWSSTEYSNINGRGWVRDFPLGSPAFFLGKPEPLGVICFSRDDLIPTDLTPDEMAFTPPGIIDADLSTFYSSDTITVSGINGIAPVSLSVTGSGSACYRINGGTCRTSDHLLLNGSTLRIDLTSGPGIGDITTATLTVGTGSVSFSASNAESSCVSRDLSALALGAFSCDEGREVIYGGQIGEERLYVTPMTGTYMWKTAFTGTSGTASTTDGAANTTSMTSTLALQNAHPAATACRSLGLDWYLPARDEVVAVRGNRNQGKLAELATPAGVFWTSTQSSNFNAIASFWGGTANSGFGKPELFPIFCMSRTGMFGS
jgi:hypothetical protein